MLSIDGSSAEDGSDCFCYHSSSRLIFPINFAKLNNIPLSPPFGKMKFHFIHQDFTFRSGYQGEFEWEKYLRETNSVYAPRDLFQVVKVREALENCFSALLFQTIWFRFDC